jgi:type IV pilus assembly protein PilC
MKFRYTGYDRTARKIEGELEAATELEARQKLRAQAIRPIRLVGSGGVKNDFSLGDLLGGSPVPSLNEFTAFIRQLATMQEAGIPVVQALNVLSEQSENRGFGQAIARVAKNIEEGLGLTDALRKHPKIFDRVFINLVAAGEVSGSLDKVLQRLALYYEKAASLQRKVKSAAAYPTLVFFLVVGVVFFMMAFVVPTFQSMFAQNKAELPAMTKVLIQASGFVQQYWYMIVGGFVSLIVGAVMLLKNPEFRRGFDPFLLRVPLFGPLIMKIGIARFARTFGTMIQSGVPILEALEITSRVAGNYAIETAIAKTRQSITEGNSIADPLAKARVFPKMAISMIAIGEQTGALDQMLTKIAEFYEDEVDAAVTAVTSVMEPLMIVFVGIVVLVVLVPMYLPLFKMGDVIGGS